MVFKGRATNQVLSRKPLTAEARIRYQAIPCETCDAYNGRENGVFSLIITPTKLHTDVSLHIALNRGTNRRSLNFHESNNLPEMWNRWIDRYLVFKWLRKNLEWRLN